MVIKNPKNQYYVIQKVKSSRDFDVLHCRLLDTEDTATYDLLRIKNREKMPYLIEIFTEQADYQTFYDLFECFSAYGQFFIAFVHNDSQSLKNKLESEQCILRERLEIGKNLIEKVILYSMPDFLQADILNIDNILVSPDLTVSFSYNISSLENIKEADFSKIIENFIPVMEKLFLREIEKQESADILKFIETCHEYHFRDMLEFYQEYKKLYDVILSRSEEGFIKPNTILFRIWNKIKEEFVKWKGRIIKIILLILLIAMIKVIFTEETKSGTDFSKIGTVEIGMEADTTGDADAE